jgi:hypothetical protein
MNTERRLLLEIARALSRLLRDFDRTQFPRGRDWSEHQKHAHRLDYLAADLEHGTDEAGARIAAMEAAGWKS